MPPTDRKLIATRCAVALLPCAVLLLWTPVAQAQASGTTTVNIELPDLVVLHHVSRVDVGIAEDAVRAEAAGSSSSASAAPAGSTGNPTGAAAPGNGSSIARLRLSRAWAIRAVTGGESSSTQVVIAVGNSRLMHTSGSAFITIEDAGIGNGGSFGPTLSVPVSGLTTVVTGDVELTLDLSRATEPGSYEAGTYTITATNL